MAPKQFWKEIEMEGSGQAGSGSKADYKINPNWLLCAATSKVRMRWVLRPGHKRNELWDLMVYNYAAGRMIGVERLKTTSHGGQVKQRSRAPKPRGRRGRFPMLGGR